MGIFARPLGVLVEYIYKFVAGAELDFKVFSAYAIAIIIATIIVKFILLPLTLKQTKSMKNMQKIQPKLQELQKKYKNDKETLNMKTMELYKEYKVNPFGGCLPLLIQFPIIIGFFNVLRNPVKYVFENQAAYDAINKSFLWIENLENPDLWILPIVAALTTYFQSKMMSPSTSSGGDDKAQSTQNTMTKIMPIMILFFARSVPSGLALYWVISNTFQIVQQFIINRNAGSLKEELK
ncbi:YidC/Oxa1 family membrane protein insertase [Clostridium sp. D2Q-14]|uniref:YidC/Oxa1 family membrane protein insertase n=1 Tax=Anaeromonas gelatinilytica TaxID=2683194 RepID=UPI00193BA40C|nr:YidC/Oxa1 family membrane protein insertase [Anaeromonas gelatinilytica]MBS4534950.1 YidC/Oxa1 family membrane protein insertase [Anaeromonas gelatinilytica]